MYQSGTTQIAHVHDSAASSLDRSSGETQAQGEPQAKEGGRRQIHTQVPEDRRGRVPDQDRLHRAAHRGGLRGVVGGFEEILVTCQPFFKDFFAR